MISVGGNGRLWRKILSSQALRSAAVVRGKGFDFRALHLCRHHYIIAVPHHGFPAGTG